MKKVANGIFGIYARAESIPLLETLRRAFTFLIPIFLIGAGTLVLQDFPVTAVREFIQTDAGGSIYSVLSLLYNITFGFAAVYLAFAIPFFDTAKANIHSTIRLAACICSLGCYLAFLDPDVLSGAKNARRLHEDVEHLPRNFDFAAFDPAVSALLQLHK